MFGEAWSPMSVPDLAPDDDLSRHFPQRDEFWTGAKRKKNIKINLFLRTNFFHL